MLTKERNAELRKMYERGITEQERMSITGEEWCRISVFIGESIAEGFKNGIEAPRKEGIVKAARDCVRQVIQAHQKAEVVE